MMIFVPRSPRQSSRMTAVVEAGGQRARGRVRDVSTTGAFVESDAELEVGQKVAVLSLAGDDDGTRRPAEVARVELRGHALKFVDGATLPSDAPVFIFTDDDAENDDESADGDPIALHPSEPSLLLKNQSLLEENGALQRQVTALQARLSLRWSTEEALVKRISTLEELLKRAMVDGW